MSRENPLRSREGVTPPVVCVLGAVANIVTVELDEHGVRDADSSSHMPKIRLWVSSSMLASSKWMYSESVVVGVMGELLILHLAADDQVLDRLALRPHARPEEVVEGPTRP